jgi:DNA polymerase-3 subunit beta
MQAVIPKNELVAGLRTVLNVVTARTTLPVLNNVLLEAEENGLLLTTTDLEVGIRTRASATAATPGSTTLPAKKFAQIVGSLPDGDISLDTDAAQMTSISCGKAFFRMVGLDAREFPQESDFSEEWAFTMKADEFRKTLSKVSYSCSLDETRHVLNGILLSVRGGVLTVAATDGRRLALVEKAVEGDSIPDGDVILPQKVVYELQRSLQGSQDVRVRVSEARVAFAFGNTVMTSKLVEGTYPNYRQVIPATFAHSIAIPRDTFSTVLGRVSMVVSESSGAVKFRLENAQMQVSATSPEFGEAKEPLEVAYQGEPFEISFNPGFFTEPLRNLECDQVVMQFNDEYSPVSLSGDEGFLYVVMPMRG